MKNRQSYGTFSVGQRRYPSSSQEHYDRYDRVSHTRCYGSFIEIKSDLRENKALIFLKVVLTIQFNLKEKDDAITFKNEFSSTNISIFTSVEKEVIILVKQIKLGFFNIVINNPLSSSVFCVAQIRFKFRGQL